MGCALFYDHYVMKQWEIGERKLLHLAVDDFWVVSWAKISKVGY
jgi:hypothetical protein